jgi:hypothetical protein
MRTNNHQNGPFDAPIFARRNPGLTGICMAQANGGTAYPPACPDLTCFGKDTLYEKGFKQLLTIY